MALNFENDFTIALTRHGPKRWSHNGSEPACVEETTLTWLADYGIEGWFTERGPLADEILAIVMAWPAKFKPFPKFIWGSKQLFFEGTDTPNKKHKFSCEEIETHFKAFNDDDLYERLLEFKIAGIKKPFCKNSSELDIDKLFRYYRVLGKAGLTEKIFPTRVPYYAVLDLLMWDEEGFLELEVKAPGDSLMKHQAKQIEYARSLGVRSCVIDVIEK